jgi:hypothetical protein
MDNFDNPKFQYNRATAPKGMYGQVRERIIYERIRIAKTRQQLTAGAALLLIVGVVNVAVIVFFKAEKPKTTSNAIEKTLYETYFDNTINLLK